MAQTLGSVAVGTVVKINESGSPVNYLVVHQGLPSSMYDASCNGTWVLRQDIYENAVWDAGNSNVLPGADIFTTMAGMLSLYDSFIQNAIQTVKIPYCVGNGSATVRSGANGLQCQIFPLSGYEVGWATGNAQYFPVDGSLLSYFNNTTDTDTKRIAKINGNPSNWWLRSPSTYNSVNVWYVTPSGFHGGNSAKLSYGIRNAFVLSQTLYVGDDGTVVLYPSPSPITVPSVAMQGQSINVSWPAVGSADSYILQRKADSGEWTQVYAGALTSYTDTAGSWSTVQYQVCGVFSGTNGAFAQSDSITVLAASALVISGTDGDLGTIVNDIPYSVATDTGNQISLTRTVNGAQVATATVQNGFSYNIPVLDLPTGTNTIVITATVTASSGQVTATRTWTYTKAAQTFPGSGGLGQLTQDGQNLFPLTLAEAVKAIGGPWGGNLSTALDKLALAATYAATPIPKYSQVDVNLLVAHLGDIVNLPENGVMVPFYVGSVNYEPTLNTSGARVLLIRKDVYQMGQWNSSGVNTYANSTIDNWFNNTYKSMLDSTVQSQMGTTTFKYTPGNGENTVTTLERAVFALSLTELAKSGTAPGANTEGDTLPIASTLQVAYMNGSAIYQWTRSPHIGNSVSVWNLNNAGDAGNNGTTASTIGFRPCFTLPVTFTATYYVDESGNVYPSQEYTTAGDFYDLWGNVIPTVKIATGSYTGTGTNGSSNANTLTFGFVPKIVFIGSSTGAIAVGGFINASGYAWAAINGSISQYAITLNWDGNSVSWYANNNADSQLNHSGTTYYYVAIG